MRNLLIILLLFVSLSAYCQVSYQDVGNTRQIDTNGRFYVIPKPGKTLGTFNVLKPMYLDSNLVVNGSAEFLSKITGDINITGDFKINDVAIGTGSSDTSFIRKYDSTRFALRLWSINGHLFNSSITLTKSDFGIDTTNYAKSSDTAGLVHTYRTINGNALTSNITLTKANLGIDTTNYFNATNINTGTLKAGRITDSAFKLTNLDTTRFVDMGDTTNIVWKTRTQTLTNKTLTSPIMTSPTLGTVSSGTWQGTAIDTTYINSKVYKTNNLDTTDITKNGENNTLTGLNIFSGYKNTFKSLRLTSGANDTIRTTDDFDLFLGTSDTTRLRITNRGNFYFPAMVNNSSGGSWYKGTTRFIHTFQAGGSDGHNLFMGLSSGNFTLTSATSYKASYNTAFGENTLTSLTDGYYNTAIGYNCLNAVTTGSLNFGQGAFTMCSLTSGNYNLGIGGQCMVLAGTSSEGNTMLGSRSGYGVTNGVFSYNTCIGMRSGYTFNTANYNTCVGTNAGDGLTTGSRNIQLGNFGSFGVAMSTPPTTGSYNILIGDNVNLSSQTVSRELNIAKSIYATGLYMDSVRIGIKAINPHSTFQDSGSFALQYSGKTATYTVGEKDYCVNFTTAGDTANLPTAIGKQGRIYVIKNSAASGTVVVDPYSTQTIDGVTTKSLTTQYSRVTIMSDNANWIILSE